MMLVNYITVRRESEYYLQNYSFTIPFLMLIIYNILFSFSIYLLIIDMTYFKRILWQNGFYKLYPKKERFDAFLNSYWFFLMK